MMRVTTGHSPSSLRRTVGRWAALLLVILAGLLAIAGCGGGGGGGGSTTVTVAVVPGNPTIAPATTQQFDAVVTGTTNTSVTWSVVGGPANGTITPTGLYTAPGNPGTYTVRATSATGSSRFGEATVTVVGDPVVHIVLTPTSANVAAGQTRQFTATVTGTSNTGVLWSLDDPGSTGSTISPTGLFTAGSTAGTVTVRAAAAADVSKVAEAEVIVSPVPTIQVTVNPSSANLTVSQSQQFSATVTGTTLTGVTWSVVQGVGGGTITQTGLYTAPPTPGTYTVRATSVANPNRWGEASVFVTAPPTVSVHVSPTAVTLAPLGTQQFTATVSGSADTSVTWSVTPSGGAGGTITQTGLYTAPTLLGTYTVRATSNADPTKSGTAAVTVSGTGGFPANRIIYGIDLLTSFEIYSVRGDGGENNLIANMPENYRLATISPTGQFAFFYSETTDASARYDLYTGPALNVASATRRTFNNFLYVGTLQYTPDNGNIVFTAALNEDDFGVYRIPATAGGAFRLGDGEDAHVRPTGNGNPLVITRIFGTNPPAGEIGTMDLFLGTFTRLTTNTADDWMPQWRFDGAQIVFSSDRGGPEGVYQIYTMNENGTNVRRVTNTGQSEFGPTFSPNGAQIAFVRYGFEPGIFRVNADGSNPVTVLLNEKIMPQLYWTPNSGNLPNAFGPSAGAGLRLGIGHRPRKPWWPR